MPRPDDYYWTRITREDGTSVLFESNTPLDRVSVTGPLRPQPPLQLTAGTRSPQRLEHRPARRLPNPNGSLCDVRDIYSFLEERLFEELGREPTPYEIERASDVLDPRR